ncbi:aldo/keto reductase [Actinoplanes sp. CA-131856]
MNADAAGTWKLGDRVVNRMGFGSMRLTPRPDTSVAIKVLRTAVELGVDHIDTAAFYVSPGGVLGVGEGPPRFATELIREALEPYPRELVIATKVGPWAETVADLRAHVEENLRRLGVERLDLVNLRLTRRGGSVAERFGVLAGLRAEGLIRDLGLSNATLDQVDEASAIAPVVCVQTVMPLICGAMTTWCRRWPRGASPSCRSSRLPGRGGRKGPTRTMTRPYAASRARAV